MLRIPTLRKLTARERRSLAADWWRNWGMNVGLGYQAWLLHRFGATEKEWGRWREAVDKATDEQLQGIRRMGIRLIDGDISECHW